VKIGVALPSLVPAAGREELLGWAREAETAGFSSLAVGDRLVYDSHEPLVALAAAAAVTDRIGLLTNVIVLPWRLNAAVTAKQLATIQTLSGGRLSVGVGVGGREDDFRLGGSDRSERGRSFDSMLEAMLRVWRGEDEERAKVGPRLSGAPRLLIGGSSPSTYRRVARYADGWTVGVGTIEQLRSGVERLREAWKREGREGAPRIVAVHYFALGAGASSIAGEYLRNYYAFLGPVADRIAALAATDADAIRALIPAYSEAGVDELFFYPTSAAMAQLRALAETVL